jgi:hypothetical protein
MTIRIPPEKILDKILALFGKKRKIITPDNAGEIYGKYGPYVSISAKCESFFKALFRKKSNENVQRDCDTTSCTKTKEF